MTTILRRPLKALLDFVTDGKRREEEELSFRLLHDLEARPLNTRNVEELVRLSIDPDIPRAYEKECQALMDKGGSFEEWLQTAQAYDPNTLSSHWDSRWSDWHEVHLHAMNRCAHLASSREELQATRRLANFYNFSDAGEDWTSEIKEVIRQKTLQLRSAK